MVARDPNAPSINGEAKFRGQVPTLGRRRCAAPRHCHRSGIQLVQRASAELLEIDPFEFGDAPQHARTHGPRQAIEIVERPVASLGEITAALDLAGRPLAQRLVGVAGLASEPPERALDLGVALAQSGQHLGPQPHAKLVWIAVAGVVDELQTEPPSQLADLRARELEHRSQPRRLVDGHRGQPIEPRSTSEVHEHGLGLIGRRVGQDDRRRAELAGLLDQRVPASLASAIGQSWAERQPDSSRPELQPKLLGERGDHRGLAGRLDPQAVVDVADGELEIQARSQRPEQPERHDRVGSARTRDQESPRRGSAFEAFDRHSNQAECAGDRRILPRCVRVHRTQSTLLDVDNPDIHLAPAPKFAPEDLQRVVDEPLSLERLDDAPELIAALPVQGFVTVARKLRDEQRLDLLLPHASPEQIVGIFDLDSWEQDRLAVVRAREWLDRIAEAYREASAPRGQLVDLLHQTDVEIWVLANAAATAIADLEPGDDEQRMQVLEDMATLQVWETPDGFHIVGVPNDEFGSMALRVLEAVYDDSMVEGRKLVSAIKWSTYSELEDDLLRWRRGRLADLGFPEWEEAMKLFVPLAHDTVMGRDGSEPERKRSPFGPSGPSRPPLAETLLGLAPSLRSEGKDLLRRVMEVLSEREYDLRLREFLLLANELMAAQRFEPGDEALQTRAVDQARATLNLACELLVAREAPEDPEGFIAERITSVGLRKLFRYGYGPLHKLRKAALALHKGGQVSLREVGSLLDRPWGPALASFVRWFPELPIESAVYKPGAKLATRPLRTLADLARATSLIGEADALARLCFSTLGFAVDPIWLTRTDDPSLVHLGDLIRTAMIRSRLPGANEFAPIGPDDLLWARTNLLDKGQAIAELGQEFTDKAIAVGVGERAATLADVVLVRLAIELAGLEPDLDGKLDLTRIGGLLTIQQVGMWLTTRTGVGGD